MSASEGSGPSLSRAALVAPGSEEPAATSFSAAPGPASAAAWGTVLGAWAQTAPVALALLDAAGGALRVNPAFELLTGIAAANAGAAAIARLFGAPDGLPASGELVRRELRHADGGELACDVQCEPAGPGLRLLTLVDRRAEAAHEAAARRLAEKLDFIQTHARIGTWERDVRTREGQWDRHMFQFFGLDPARGTPSIAQVAQASMPQDRLALVLENSMRKPGHYDHRYRLLTQAGQMRHVRSHWNVLAAPDGSAARVIGLVMDEGDALDVVRTIDDDGAQLQLAMELADVSMWRHDLATQRFQFNERAYRMLGFEPRQDGMSVDELRSLIHPDDLPEVLATFERALRSHRPEDLQARYRHDNGSWRTIFTRRVTQRDALGTPIAFAGVGLDITEQVERLRRSDELARQLEQVAAASGIGVWRILRDGSGADWNPQMYALCGLPPDQPPPHFHDWVDACVHPGDRERVRGHGLHWINEADAATELPHRLVLPDGRIRHVVARGRVEPEPSPYRLTGVMIDVTEREAALAALREATERSALATRAAGIGIWEWEMDSGVSRWDEQMYVLRGLPPDSSNPTLEKMSTFVHPEDRNFVNDQIHSARVEDRAAYYEFRIVRPDGAIRWLASRSLPVRDERGRTRLRLGVNWDITEARAADAARHERALVLRESQAKSELLARMSHELRTPMNAVLGFTQLLLAEEGSDAFANPADAARDARRIARLEHIRCAGEHLLTLINDVLELSRMDAPKEREIVLAPVRLAEVIEQSLPLVERLAQQHGVTVEAPECPLYVRADATRLKQVLVNLLSNAIKYNRVGGHVRLDVAPVDGRVRLTVADDGIGMTSAQQELVFEPFNRAGAERDGVEGTGIGLTIVKALVERMGGRIAVHSTPDVGSVFEVWLDAAADSGPHALPARRLLSIADNADTALTVSELVRRRGDIEFDSVPDGASGVARAAQIRPGLTLVDMQLPDIDGMEVLARLRANPLTAGLRIVALSANAIPADIRRALDAGFDDYWTKPLDFAIFTAALDDVFGPMAG